MKTLRKLMLGCLALLVSTSALFISCSDDDDDDGASIILSYTIQLEQDGVAVPSGAYWIQVYSDNSVVVNKMVGDAEEDFDLGPQVAWGTSGAIAITKQPTAEEGGAGTIASITINQILCADNARKNVTAATKTSGSLEITKEESDEPWYFSNDTAITNFIKALAVEQ